MTELQMDSTVLGDDICVGALTRANPMLPAQTAQCVAGPFNKASAPSPILFIYPENDGFRHGTVKDGFFDEPILPQIPVAGASVLTFYFEPTGGADGPTVAGSTGQTTVDFPASAGLSGPVAVDCTDRFTNGFSDLPDGTPRSGVDPVDPRVVAYRITRYSATGGVEAKCDNIVELVANFDASTLNSDTMVHYQGG
jgi:hypothetical protein